MTYHWGNTCRYERRGWAGSTLRFRPLSRPQQLSGRVPLPVQLHFSAPYLPNHLTRLPQNRTLPICPVDGKNPWILWLLFHCYLQIVTRYNDATSCFVLLPCCKFTNTFFTWTVAEKLNSEWFGDELLLCSFWSELCDWIHLWSSLHPSWIKCLLFIKLHHQEGWRGGKEKGRLRRMRRERHTAPVTAPSCPRMQLYCPLVTGEGTDGLDQFSLVLFISGQCAVTLIIYNKWKEWLISTYNPYIDRHHK